MQCWRRQGSTSLFAIVRFPFCTLIGFIFWQEKNLKNDEVLWGFTETVIPLRVMYIHSTREKAYKFDDKSTIRKRMKIRI